MMTKLRIGFAAAILVAIPLFLQRRSQDKLRHENQALRVQADQLEVATAESQRLSNLVAKTKQPIAQEAMHELMRLRSEVGSLRDDKNELDLLRKENQQLREEAQKAQNELRTALSESAQQAIKRLCIENLKAIAGAKYQWSVENKKTNGAPTIGMEKEIDSFFSRTAPRCPEGGIYTYNPTGIIPSCSLGISAGHTVPQP